MINRFLIRAISAMTFAGLAVSAASADTLFNVDQNNGSSTTQTGAAVIGSTGDFLERKWECGTVTNMTLAKHD